MKTWHRLVSLVLVVVLLGGLAIAAATSSNLPMAAAPQQGAASLEGAYSVAVELAYVQPGVYTDVLPTPNPDSQSPDLGLIDVGLLLNQTDTGVTGYVDLSQTLVFTQEHIIQATPVAAAEGAALVALAVGPQVSGSFDGTNLRLTSEKVVYTTDAGQTIERQFLLEGTTSADNPGVITGQYRETLWSYGTEPYTVVGTFQMLIDTTAAIPSSDHQIFLPIVQR